LRIFVAIELSEEVLAQARILLEDLGKEVPAVRWARPESLHVTLKFLGEVGDERVDSIGEALDRAAAGGGTSPFTFEVEGLGTFGERKRPRVVWAGVRERSGALSELYAAAESACVKLGFGAEDRPFHPHLTLARLKGPVPRLGRALAKRSGVRFGSTEVRSFMLIRSELRPEGALYTTLRRFSLPQGKKRDL